MQTFDGPVEGVSLNYILCLMVLICKEGAKVFEASSGYDKSDSLHYLTEIVIEATTSAALRLVSVSELLLELGDKFLKRELSVFILREELLKYLPDIVLTDVFAFKEQKDMEEVPGGELVDLELSDFRERLCES